MDATQVVASDASRIPAELNQLDQWVVWRLKNRGGKATKMPYDACTGRRASVTQPST